MDNSVPKPTHEQPIDTGEPPADEPVGKPSDEEIDDGSSSDDGAPLTDIKHIPSPLV